MGFEIIQNNRAEVEQRLDDAIERALDAVGLQAENYARNNAPTVTGLLKNSITSAVGGKGTRISSYSDDVGKKSGSYSGTAQETNSPYVIIGSNVEYAPYVELGSSRSKAHPFLWPAIQDHFEEFKNIFENELQNG